jgi:transcriptional regulator
MYNKIKILCKERGISIHTMEKELGFGGGTISRWKNSNPGFDKILKIANFLGVSVEFLTDFKAGGKGTRTERIYKKISLLDSKKIRQLEAYLDILGGSGNEKY